MTFCMRGNNDPGIVIQERDRHLMNELAVMRVIDREQAKVVARFGSTTRANTRLLALSKNGLLRRFFLGANGGSKKALYALSKKGAALIGVTPRGPRRPNNGLLVADFFVLHQLAINQVYCELKYRTQIPGVSFVRWLSFHTPVSQALRLIPDGYVELKNPTGMTAAFVEIDLGHERLAVWKRKIKNYLQLALSADSESPFGQHRFRVLVIVNSEHRLRSIRKAVRSATQKIFWFTTMDAIERNGFLAYVWLRPEGDQQQSFFPNASPK